ncbi:MAG TPA: hypothetical protein PK990_04570 [Salinivirgaceae bacterium]|nr:hypothetical protein [Salinivirgaceae bacterium]
MKKALQFFILGLLIHGCSHNIEYRVVETYPSGKPKIEIGIISNKDGILIEHYRELWETGGVKIKGQLKNGKRDGKWESFYEKGAPWSVGFYTDGVRNGRSLIYYPNGVFMMNGYYKNDIKDSIWYNFSETGDTLQTALFRDGKLVFISDKENVLPVKSNN